MLSVSVTAASRFAHYPAWGEMFIPALSAPTSPFTRTRGHFWGLNATNFVWVSFSLLHWGAQKINLKPAWNRCKDTKTDSCSVTDDQFACHVPWRTCRHLLRDRLNWIPHFHALRTDCRFDVNCVISVCLSHACLTHISLRPHIIFLPQSSGGKYMWQRKWMLQLTFNSCSAGFELVPLRGWPGHLSACFQMISTFVRDVFVLDILERTLLE